MRVSCSYLPFICNIGLIYLFTYKWFINNNTSFICLYRPGLFICLFIYIRVCVFCYDNVSTSDDIPINARIITEYRIGLNVAICETFVLPDLEVRIEMFIRIAAILSLNVCGVHQYLHANDKMIPNITAQSLPSTYFPNRYSRITVSFDCTYSDLLTTYWNKPRDMHFSFTGLKASYKVYVQHND